MGADTQMMEIVITANPDKRGRIAGAQNAAATQNIIDALKLGAPCGKARASEEALKKS